MCRERVIEAADRGEKQVAGGRVHRVGLYRAGEGNVSAGVGDIERQG